MQGLSSEKGFGEVVLVNTGRQLDDVNTTDGRTPWQT
jgi:hypothetical protein